MGILRRRDHKRSGVACPACSSHEVGLGYIDRVKCTVLHACRDCGNRWHDDLIDLADSQLATRTRR